MNTAAGSVVLDNNSITGGIPAGSNYENASSHHGGALTTTTDEPVLNETHHHTNNNHRKSQSFGGTPITIVPPTILTKPSNKRDITTTPVDGQELDELDDDNTVSGVAPGADTSKHAYCTPRRAIVNCQNLEVISEKLKNRKLRICVYIKERVYKRRKTLKSSIIDVPTLKNQANIAADQSLQVPLNNISFKLKYSHHFKKKIDILRISLQSAKKKGDSFKTISIVSINLLHVLQRPFDETVSFLIKKKKKKQGKEEGGENSPNQNNLNNTPNHTLFNTNSAILHYLSSDDEDEEKERYHNHQTHQTSQNLDPVANLKVSIQTLPISLTEERKKKKKFPFLGKKESTNPNGIVPVMESYEYDFTDDDDETDDDSDIEYEYATGLQPGTDIPASPINNPISSPMADKSSILKEDKTLKAVIGIKDNIMKKWKSFKKKGHHNDSDHEPTSPRGAAASSENPTQITIKIDRIPIQEQLKELLSNKTIVKKIILINGSFRRGQRIWSFLKRTGGLYSKDILCTYSCEDVALAINKIFESNAERRYVSDQENNETKIVILGNDAYVNDVLRACLTLTTDEKVWNQILFYLVPIPSKKGEEVLHRSRNEVSNYLYAKCTKYAQLFSTDDWRRALCYSVDVEDYVEHVLFEYLENASRFVTIEISQVILMSDLSTPNAYLYPHTSRVIDSETAPSSPSELILNQQCIVPLLNNIHIMNEHHEQKKKNILLKLVQNLNKEDEKDPKEKSHKKEIIDKSNNPPSAAQVLSTSPQISNLQKRLSVENDEDSSDEGEDGKLEKVPSLEVKIDYWDASLEDKSKCTTKHSFSHVEIFKLPSTDLPDEFQPKPETFTLSTSKPKKKKKQPNEEIERKCNLTKVICKVEKKKQTARAVIDGVEWSNVKVISVTPKWVNNLSFKVASFK
ncbi:predicted protein [Naegleria gruberi]|uniref:Predicted protein n=1 Tax=Naegleria gruberi TaxID=5762 RepID=D2VMD9_NAEGR|nr:uncharacterized protein NAEGRDRAFT_50745 [Naegleria gruberi]EFC41972.1 predicted protein [Naegleria gruberi]|eukprot:XP_002674716.1 predicted protein [Naegleria gruberi strain NEG-M]